jgi:hypothetical protein
MLCIASSAACRYSTTGLSRAQRLGRLSLFHQQDVVQRFRAVWHPLSSLLGGHHADVAARGHQQQERRHQRHHEQRGRRRAGGVRRRPRCERASRCRCRCRTSAENVVPVGVSPENGIWSFKISEIRAVTLVNPGARVSAQEGAIAAAGGESFYRRHYP